MTRRRWFVVVGVFLVIAALAVLGALIDDGTDSWHRPPPRGGGETARPSAADDEATREARDQFLRVFASCGERYRAQRSGMRSISRNSSGPTLAQPVTVTWEYRGVTFEPHPAPLSEVEGFNKITWHGDVLVRYAATRQGTDKNALWQAGDPLVLRMQKRDGKWDVSAQITELLKARWSARC